MVSFRSLSHEQRFEAILSSVNTEYKASTLLVCLSENYRSSVDMMRTLLSYTEGSGVRVPLNYCFFAYCHHTFLPIGLVVEERIKRTNADKYILSWRLTEDGIRYGKPAAALAIRAANNFNLSLHSVLGLTSSPGYSRSPYNRAKILMTLNETKNLRVTDLANLLNLDKSLVARHCKALSKSGFINYESISTEEKGYSTYEHTGMCMELIIPYPSYPNLTKKVAEFFVKNKGEWNRHDISKKVRYKDIHAISCVISHLEREGFLRRATEFKAKEILSNARIKDRGREFVQSFLKPLYEGLNPSNEPESIEEFVKPLHEYESNNTLTSNHVRNACDLYSIVCPTFKRECSDLRKTRIKKIIKEEGRLRAKDVWQRLGVNPTKYLRKLIEANEIKKVRDGRAVYYSLVESD
jgi:Mn-dependent DtxR family transcriptional regulator